MTMEAVRDRELALLAQVQEARERALQLQVEAGKREVEAAKREAALQVEAAAQREEAARREAAL